MKPLIQLDKQYKTRDGREAIVHTVTAPGSRPVIGSVKCGADWEERSWTGEGAFHQGDFTSCADLIEVIPLWEGEIYIHANGSVRNASYFSISAQDRMDASRDWRKIKVKQVEDPT